MRKVTIIISFAIIAIAGITLNSCEKSSTEGVAPVTKNSNPSSIINQKYFEALPHALAAFKEKQIENGNLKSGAVFIPAFVTSDGFGFIKDFVGGFDPDCGCFIITSGEFAFFSTELDGNDFYRLNPDGTVSVHISSNNALAEYANFGTGKNASGDGAKMSMDYTGTWVVETFEWDGVTYTFQFIDTSDSRNTMLWNGTGKVQFDGMGQNYNLGVHLAETPGSQTNAWLRLN
jgi:hypothetical protein